MILTYLTFGRSKQTLLVVECLTGDPGVMGSSLTVLWPLARHIYPCLVLVQPIKIRLDKTEKLLTWT